MITEANRFRVSSVIVDLQREADQFHAFTAAQQFTVADMPSADAAELMTAWARAKSRQFDIEFQKLAKELGYTVSKAGETVGGDAS